MTDDERQGQLIALPESAEASGAGGARGGKGSRRKLRREVDDD